MTKSTRPYDLVRDLKRLKSLSPHFSRALKSHGYPAPRVMAPGFATLVRIILGQQVSTHSAAAMWAKLTAACDSHVRPACIVKLGPDGLRSLGFSGQKARYVLGLAEAAASGELDFAALARAPDDEVRTILTAHKGIGQWTADIYLMFGLGRGDIWPAADIGLHAGIQILHGLEKRPNAEEASALAEAWRPYRSSAAVLLWHYYGANRRIERAAPKKKRRKKT
jgi:DNA-3-methyladenine glycosylase II